MIYWKGFGRKRSLPDLGTVPAIGGGTDDNEDYKSSGDSADIPTKPLSDTSPERYRRANLLGLTRYAECQFFLS